jgi:UDPglucose 6-dehydrogenase
MKIAMIGTGYVGLTSGACFAHIGHNVICVDNDEQKIHSLLKGQIPFFEPKLTNIIKENIKNGRLQFSNQIGQAIKQSTVIFIAVGTPPKESGELDLSDIENVAREISLNINQYKIIVEKSTVPVRTYEKIKKLINQNNKHRVSFDVASNPEFLREGTAVDDFLHPDRIVIGTESVRAKNLLNKLYQPIDAPILNTDIESAELIKHASNAFLSMKISFINAISIICEMTGASIDKVAQGIGLDKRIGSDFLNAGVGYGGSCLPKDLQSFVQIADELGYDFRLLKEVVRINEDQKKRFVNKITKLVGKLQGKQIGILGLSFKPNTDDMRFAPSIDTIKMLKSAGAKIKAFDPHAMNNAKKIMPNIEYCKTPYDVARKSDALVIITEWNEFRNLNLFKIKKLLKTPIVVDGRNLFDPITMKKLGFIYQCIGR